MNFVVQSLIQDLENMGRFASAVSKSEWQDKWTVLNSLEPAEYNAVSKACDDNPFRKKAWDLALAHDPDPAKTARKSAFEGLFKI